MKTLEKYAPYGAPAARVLLALIFVIAGYGKIFNYAGTQGYMEKFGVPGMLLPLVILAELGGGLALLAGWQTRIAAFLLAGFALLAAFIFHHNFADRIDWLFFLKDLAIAGGLLALVAHGPGPLALDTRK